MKVYVIGSLRNPNVVQVGNRLRAHGIDAFDDWHGGGPEADDHWKHYEQTRGRSYKEALYDRYATHIWEFDKAHLDSSDAAVMVHPVGRSAHIELGYVIGQGKPAYILFDDELEETRWDVMYRFATKVFFHVDDLISFLARTHGTHVLTEQMLKEACDTAQKPQQFEANEATVTERPWSANQYRSR